MCVRKRGREGEGRERQRERKRQRDRERERERERERGGRYLLSGQLPGHVDVDWAELRPIYTHELDSGGFNLKVLQRFSLGLKD